MEKYAIKNEVCNLRIWFTSRYLLFRLRDSASYKVRLKTGKKYSRMSSSQKSVGARRGKYKKFGSHAFKKKMRVCDQAINYYARTIPLT
jgi:hypothetical protein